jgi:hypothetical protein
VTRHLTGDELVARIGAVRHSALRWECQPHYDEPSEVDEVRAWEDGNPIVPVDDPWFGMVRGLTAAGRRVARVRVHEEPPTSYQQWLDWLATVGSKPAGEEVRVISRARALEVGLPASRSDWWLLDGRQLIVMTFNPDGRLTSTVSTRSPLRVLRARAQWDLAVRHSTPLSLQDQGVLTIT